MAGLWISIAVPLLGLIVFGVLVNLMLRQKIEDPPVAEFFWLFVFYGGALQAILTELYWEWAVGPIAGVFILAFIGPFFLGYLAWRIRKQRRLSIFHRAAFILCLLYPVVLLILGLLAEK